MMEAQQVEDSPFVKLARENYPPELVSPMVVLLAHESCPVSGECFAAGGNKVQRILLSETAGLTLSQFTPEQLYQNFERVMTAEGASVIEPGYMDTSKWSVKPYVRKKEQQ
jgi:hypothetical protein